MTKYVDGIGASDRSILDFVRSVRKTFKFLVEAGFAETETLPTLVRYQKGAVEVDVYHGRRSYEIGSGITFSGVRYAMSEILRASDPELAKSYLNAVATNPEAINTSLQVLSALMQRYGSAAMEGDSKFFSKLGALRKQWAEEYALDVLEGQLRPQAEAAFRQGEYLRAAQLYGRIRMRLSHAEAKKLAIAEERSKD